MVYTSSRKGRRRRRHAAKNTTNHQPNVNTSERTVTQHREPLTEARQREILNEVEATIAQLEVKEAENDATEEIGTLPTNNIRIALDDGELQTAAVTEWVSEKNTLLLSPTKSTHKLSYVAGKNVHPTDTHANW